jgi:Flp pilus assembly protein TadD
MMAQAPMEGVTAVTTGDIERRVGRRRLNRPAVAALLAALALACASTGVRETGESALLRELERREVGRALVPFALNDEMAAWVHEAVGAAERDQRLDRLVEAVTEASMLGVEYKAGRTGSAVEVFESRTANCLAFTQMFVGMARELDLAAYFVEVSHVENFEREGDLVVISDHVAVGFGPRHAMRVIDFGLREEERGFRVSPISDLTATALYYSNRGAEALRAERLDEAIAWLEDAVRIDPELASAWANLGVAQRRSGRTGQAELSYRQALVVDPGLSSALVNLAVLLRLNGRTEEADDLLLMADARRNRNPFTYIALGDLSLRYGRLDEAERFYSRARRLGPDEAAPAAALGEVLLRRGERKAAEKLLRRAQRLEPDGDRRIDRLVRLLAAS